MTPYFLTILFASVSLGSDFAQETVGETGPWSLDHPAYAQMKIVPTPETESIITKLQGASWQRFEWNGPWEAHSTFQIRVGYSEGKQTRPKQFDFVQPNIELEGFTKDSRESHGTTVTLFAGPSKPGDIKVQVFPIKETPALDSPVKVATLSSEQEKLSWDVYVRFSDQKPDYAKGK